MQKFILICLFSIFIPLASFSQQLTLEQLISLHSKDTDDVNDFLSARGWRYAGIEEETEDALAKVNWGYNLDEYTEKASGWVHLFTNEGNTVTVAYRSNKFIIDAIKKRVIALKMDKIDSGINEYGSIYSLYIGANYGIKFTINEEGESTVLISSKEFCLE